jgi:hypothetical protein
MPKPNRAAHGLTVRAEKVIQRLTGFAVLTLAISAAVLSFSGLQKLAVDAGFDPSIAWLFPVIVDGMVLTGSLGVIAAGLVGLKTWYEWMLTILGVGISVAGNIASAPQNLTAQLVHAIAPVTFALSIEGMLRIYRASAAAQAQRDLAVIEAEERKAERESRAEERARKRQMAAVNQPTSEPGRNDVVSSPTKTAPKPTVRTSEPAEGTARSRIKVYLAENPEATAGQVARELGTDPSYTRKIVRDLKDSGIPKSVVVEVSPVEKPDDLIEQNIEVEPRVEENRLN